MSEAPAGWLRAIDEALTAAHLGIASESDDYDTAKRKLDSLIDWHVAVATDPDVNGGWKLVPVEPTQEMIEQGSSTINDSGGSARWSETREAWAAMLAAAPTPPVDDACSGCGDEIHPNYSCSDAQALRSPSLRMPEPMTDVELVEIYRALPKNGPIVRDGSTTGRLARAIEAEVMRRVQEANK